ncbi:ribonuclease H-like domain-containing protein [Tanacetum coccineum]
MAIGDPFGSGSIDLINNLDVGNPLYLQSNDNSSFAIVNVKLVGAENYKMWATTMKIALKWKNKMGFIDGWILRFLSQELYVRQVYSEIASEPIRSNILAKDPLPNVKDAFYVVSREESHRGLHPCNYATSKT